MKLIDEKIKALGLTKGQYCEKYGFKFKDFAAKVHTLEAKLEWANTFLKPLGLEVEIRDKFRHVVSGLDTSAFKVGQVLILDPESPGGLKAMYPQERIYYDETLGAVCLTSIQGGTVGEYLDKGLGKGKLSPEDENAPFLGSEAPLEVKGLVGKEEWSGWTPGSREAEDQDDADSLL